MLPGGCSVLCVLCIFVALVVCDVCGIRLRWFIFFSFIIWLFYFSLVVGVVVVVCSLLLFCLEPCARQVVCRVSIAIAAALKTHKSRRRWRVFSIPKRDILEAFPFCTFPVRFWNRSKPCNIIFQSVCIMYSKIYKCIIGIRTLTAFKSYSHIHSQCMSNKLYITEYDIY